MPDSFTSPQFAIPVLLIGGYCVVRSLASWVNGLRLLIVAVLFGGIVGVHMNSGAFPILFRDAVIVLPIYAAFFLGGASGRAIADLPGELAFGFVLVMLWLVISVFNPGTTSGFRLLIGLKVWAFYVPLLLVGVALGGRPEAMLKVLRAFLFLGLVACSIGLLQAFLIRIIGYETTMSLFFGAGARQATQGFTYFTAGGGIYRIPGTFSFNSQFVGFLYCYLVVAMIETNADPDPRVRRWAKISLFITLLTAVVSGTKGALIVFPAMIAGFIAYGVIRASLMMVAPVAGMVGLWVLSSIGVKLGGLFSFGVEQTRQYASGFFLQQIEQGLDAGPRGHGIGSNTNAARYLGGTVDFSSLTGFESYYAKIAAELGAIGLVIFGAFFLIILFRITMSAIHHYGGAKNAIIAPVAVYIAMTMAISFKAWALDIDPTNIFFWLALGLAIGVERSAPVGIPAQAAGEPSIGMERAATRLSSYTALKRR